MSKFYVTTPIYYVNDAPHVGHAYTTIAADALARFHRLNGEDVFFSVGVDENSQKNLQAMYGLRKYESPRNYETDQIELAAYLERMSAAWKKTWEDLGIESTDFIRTTEERHRRGVEKFWNIVKANGDIELREYEGLYCVGCEAFKTESEIVNGRCPLHPNKDLETLKEKNYFFKLSKYRDRLLELYDGDFVMPESRRNEIRNYVADHLDDISISREAKKLSVGIPVPGDDSQRIYVWFDALINYLTVVGYGSDDATFRSWWPADLHLVGKDIIKFHCALWPAMLMSAQIDLPKQVFAHGFFTLNGQKISKSLGNAIDPREIVSKYGNDALRYFLLREISFGEDGDFSEKRMSERYDSDLGNTFGNLVNRVIAMSKRYFDGKVPTAAIGANFRPTWIVDRRLVENAYRSHRCDIVLEAIWSSLFQANKFVEEKQPFKLIKTDPEGTADVLYSLLESCRQYAWMTYPVMPTTSRRIFEQLGLDPEKELAHGWSDGLAWGGLKAGALLGEPVPLFPRTA